mgnify:FL=1
MKYIIWTIISSKTESLTKSQAGQDWMAVALVLVLVFGLCVFVSSLCDFDVACEKDDIEDCDPHDKLSHVQVSFS